MAKEPSKDVVDAALAALGTALAFAEADNTTLADYPHYELGGRHFA